MRITVTGEQIRDGLPEPKRFGAETAPLPNDPLHIVLLTFMYVR